MSKRTIHEVLSMWARIYVNTKWYLLTDETRIIIEDVIDDGVTWDSDATVNLQRVKKRHGEVMSIHDDVLIMDIKVTLNRYFSYNG